MTIAAGTGPDDRGHLPHGDPIDAARRKELALIARIVLGE